MIYAGLNGISSQLQVSVNNIVEMLHRDFVINRCNIRTNRMGKPFFSKAREGLPPKEYKDTSMVEFSINLPNAEVLPFDIGRQMAQTIDFEIQNMFRDDGVEVVSSSSNTIDPRSKENRLLTYIINEENNK